MKISKYTKKAIGRAIQAAVIIIFGFMFYVSTGGTYHIALKLLGIVEESPASAVAESLPSPAPSPPLPVTLVNLLRDPEYMARFIMYRNDQVFPELAEVIVKATTEASAKYDIPPIYLLLLMDVESRFEYTAVSKTGDLGLMQINVPIWVTDKGNARGLVKNELIKSKKDLLHPGKNIMAGAYILKVYLDEAVTKGIPEPLAYAVASYHTKSHQEHFQRFCESLGHYVVWFHQLQLQEVKTDAKA